MNFSQVEQANGNNVDMFGTITEFCGEGVNPNSGKPYKKVKIKDIPGVLHNVTLRGTLPDVSVINTRQSFQLSSYQGNYQGKPYTGYSGFWNDKIQVNQQDSYNRVSQPAQPTNTGQGTSDKPDTKNTSFALSYVKDMLCEKAIKWVDFWPTVEAFQKYMDTGKTPMVKDDEPKTNDDYSLDEPSVMDDGIPF